MVIVNRELKEDMLMLAEFVHDVALKYGDIYLTVSHCEGSEFSSATTKIDDSDDGYGYVLYPLEVEDGNEQRKY